MDADTRHRLGVAAVVTLGFVALVALFVLAPTGIGVAVVSALIAAAVVVLAGWRRLVQLVVVLVLVTFFVSVLIRLLPGDPTHALIPFSSPEQRAELRGELGLNKNVFAQYKDFVGDFVTGDTKYYQSTGRQVAGTPVWDRLGTALPVSLLLMLYAQVLALAIAIPLGILTAYRAGSRLDKGVNTSAFALLSLPNFVLAYLLIYYFAVQRDIFPTQGYVAFGESASEHFKSLFLPAVSLSVGLIAIYMRLLRSDMIQTLQEDFITMARSKGLTTRRILLRHALRPSSFTLLTVAAINLGALIGSVVIIEVIFQLPGVGLLLFQAINAKQYVAVQTFIGIIAIVYVLANVVVDLLYSVLDPRIRHARAAG
ncbi:MAG TPA: ABC transporter permease [Acidimicrobiia bacterium]|nr:ABC transporter permease [Acidimicrobiia bacterium]